MNLWMYRARFIFSIEYLCKYITLTADFSNKKDANQNFIRPQIQR